MSGYPSVTMSKVGASAPIIPNLLSSYNPYLAPVPAWSLGVICTLSSGGSATYSVQVTADQTPTANGNWNNHDTLAAQTASANGNIAYPVTGVRLNVTSYGSGTVTMGIAQWP